MNKTNINDIQYKNDPYYSPYCAPYYENFCRYYYGQKNKFEITDPCPGDTESNRQLYRHQIGLYIIRFFILYEFKLTPQEAYRYLDEETLKESSRRKKIKRLVGRKEEITETKVYPLMNLLKYHVNTAGLCKGRNYHFLAYLCFPDVLRWNEEFEDGCINMQIQLGDRQRLPKNYRNCHHSVSPLRKPNLQEEDEKFKHHLYDNDFL